MRAGRGREEEGVRERERESEVCQQLLTRGASPLSFVLTFAMLESREGRCNVVTVRVVVEHKGKQAITFRKEAREEQSIRGSPPP